MTSPPLRDRGNFVVLLHQPDENAAAGHQNANGEPTRAFRTHLDWMFEAGKSLRTWALDLSELGKQRWPAPGEKIPDDVTSIAMTALPDHRSAYLRYEGRISECRGSVRRIFEGQFVTVDQSIDRYELRLRFDSASPWLPNDKDRGCYSNDAVPVVHREALIYRTRTLDVEASSGSMAWRLDLRCGRYDTNRWTELFG